MSNILNNEELAGVAVEAVNQEIRNRVKSKLLNAVDDILNDAVDEICKDYELLSYLEKDVMTMTDNVKIVVLQELTSK